MPACGVTEVRDLGSDPFQLVAWKTKIAAGLMSGPHILQVGPMLNGKSFNRYQFPVGGTAQARTAVRMRKLIDVDGVEIERRFPRDSYFALVEESKRVGLPVCAYDDKFEALYLAYIAGIAAYGLMPRATLEVPGGARRLERIFELIRTCRYSFHDLSRVELAPPASSHPAL